MYVIVEPCVILMSQEHMKFHFNLDMVHFSDDTYSNMDGDVVCAIDNIVFSSVSKAE